MGLFSRKGKPAKGAFDFDERCGTFHMAWVNKQQPTPGAMSYAWESLALAEFTYIGPAVTTRTPLYPLKAQSYAFQAGMLSGFGTVAGGIIGQPLFDPNAPNQGYAANLNPINYNDPAAVLNIPASYPNSSMPNDPNPYDTKARL